MSTKRDLAESIGRDERAEDAIERIRAALHGLRCGAVTALVQDGVVVLVERTEKVRLPRRASPV
ncbi:MAG: DUF2292 domain-containing protein [Deltaproteobacteria bacterium]|nr:DUF2292 domain-containing protein [Deltaproteobacteria bacterium]